MNVRMVTRRAAMVDDLARAGITDARVLAAMRAVPRHRFVAPELGDEAYVDRPLPIGRNQTISSPWIVALMAQALELRPGARVLEVGTGCGYAAAVMARCGASVVTVERLPELARPARERLLALGCDTVEVREGDGALGAADRAPFDGISVAAMAADHLPPALTAQLAPHGVLVCPVGGGLVRWRDGRSQHLGRVAFVPLVTDEPGDPACWASRLCPECGAMPSQESPDRCWRCGAPSP